MPTDPPPLPERANASGAVTRLLEHDRFYRDHPWPPPFDRTRQVAVRGDARTLPIADASAGLVLTHPPYHDLKRYTDDAGGRQLGHRAKYDRFLDDLDDVWTAAHRVLVPGGRVCCVVGDVLTRKGPGRRHQVLPLPHEIMARARQLGFEVLTPILWSKVANRDGQTGRNTAFLGKPYRPNGVVNATREYVVMLRKPGYRRPSMQALGLSMLQPEEVDRWQRATWRDVPGVTANGDHPAPFPFEIAYRLIRLFSFAGDWVVDPFAGSGTTLNAARHAGRNAIGVDAVASYAETMTATAGRPFPVRRVAEYPADSATSGPRLVDLDDAGNGTDPFAVIANMQDQDVLVVRDVWDHLSDLAELRALVGALMHRNLHLRSEVQGIDTRTDRGRTALQGFWTLAKPRPAGRRRKLDAPAIERARALVAGGMSVTDTAAVLGVHRSTLHRRL